MDFNSIPPNIMHIDLNSCFATIEQQANPLLRGKPIVVAAYKTSRGCILAASIEAKKIGIKTGMLVGDAKLTYPKLVVLEPDPPKYRNVHTALRQILSRYTNDLHPKSIDEFVLNLDGYLPKVITGNLPPIQKTALEIKKRIKKEIGEHLTVSIGIAPNRFLAKLASNMEKPDGLIEINKSNFLDWYKKIKLTDLPYIKEGNALRLASVGITSVNEFYSSPLWRLKAAFRSINGYYWYLRLRGFEIDDVIWDRRSYGNSYALPKPLSSPPDLWPILAKLVTKTSSRLRSAGYSARGVHVALFYRDGSFWHKGISFPQSIFDTRDILRSAKKILFLSGNAEKIYKPVRNIAISVFNLIKSDFLQLRLFENEEKKRKLNTFIDITNKRWGDFAVFSGRMIGTANYVPDRIAFGGVKELSEQLEYEEE